MSALSLSFLVGYSIVAVLDGAKCVLFFAGSRVFVVYFSVAFFTYCLFVVSFRVLVEALVIIVFFVVPRTRF